MPEKLSSTAEGSVNFPVLLGVTAFFVWHTFAIGISAIPLTVRDPVFHPLRSFFRPIVTPYINTLAEWQDWRVFVSPDPLQYQTRFAVDLVRMETVLNSVFLTDEEGRQIQHDMSTALPILQHFCQSHQHRSGDHVRLTQRLYLDRMNPPMDPKILEAPGTAMNFNLEWYEYTYSLTTCDALSS
jgi:hypothetical protein